MAVSVGLAGPHRGIITLFGILCNVISGAVFLAPMPTFWRVFKNKSTQGFQAVPYLVSLFSCTLLLYYSFLKTEDAKLIITINTIGFIIEAFYLTVFIIYAPTNVKVRTIKLLGLLNFGVLGLIVIATMGFVRGTDTRVVFSKGGVREQTVGWICTAVSITVFASPLTVMKTVIKTRSVEFMPFFLSFSLTICAVLWFIYGLLIQDFFIAMPNVLGFLLGIGQMVLYAIYKKLSPKNQQKTVEAEDGGIERVYEIDIHDDITAGD
ncbi:bidirectional sugar transporter SWEET9-like [Silene latifolia]|uniref:bidirectional sugar transporter SWEET9-like n=1 Tax=Silene latifolia TaxID=37657 RepID=UPI003D76B6FC